MCFKIAQKSAKGILRNLFIFIGGARALGLGPGGIPLGGIAGNLDALLGGLGGQNPEMPGEIDDEAMVELAIALSLQEQGEGVDLANLQQGLQQLANLGPGLQGFPALQGLAGKRFYEYAGPILKVLDLEFYLSNRPSYF